MAPVADVALALLMCGGIFAAFAVLRRPTPPLPVLAACVALVVGGPLLQVPGLHDAAAFALTVGIAVQAGRMGRWRMPLVKANVRMLLVGAGGIVAAGAIWVSVASGMRERAALAAGGPPADGPSILLLVLDTVRAASLGLYGHPAPTTPNLERLAARAVVFEDAWSVSPWTLPSHASMFTGRWTHELSTDFQTRLDDEFPTVAEFLLARGYATAGFVGNLEYTSAEMGLDRGFARYVDYPVSAGMVARSAWIPRRLFLLARRILGVEDLLVRPSAAELNERLVAWVSEMHEAGRPSFAFVNYYDAHTPFLPPDSLAGRFGPKRSGPASGALSLRETWPADELAAERAAYEASIAYLDQEIGRLMADLERAGVLDETIVVVTSDHGEQFGEHGLTGHANSLYPTSLHVPLLIRPPGGTVGQRSGEPVTLRDLAATLLHLAGFDVHPFPGAPVCSRPDCGIVSRSGETAAEARSGSPLYAGLRSAVRPMPWWPISRGAMRSLVRDGWHYIRNGDGVEELYRVTPGQDQSDAAAREPDVVAELRAAADSIRSEPGSLPRSRPEARREEQR